MYYNYSIRVHQRKMFLIIVLVCLPLSLPCLTLVFKIISYNCLSSIFNQNILLLFLITGKYKQKQDLSFKCSAWKSFVLVCIPQFLFLTVLVISPQSWRSLYTKSQPPTVPGSLRKVCESQSLVLSAQSLVLNLFSPYSLSILHTKS